MNYVYKEYLKYMTLVDDFMSYKHLSKISVDDTNSLAKIYCTLFNSDNVIAINTLGVKGRSTPEGIWNEKPYEFETTINIINKYKSDNYFGIAAYGHTTEGLRIIGATVFQKRARNELQSKGYILPFDVPKETELWCEIDTFRVEAKIDNQPLKHIAPKMREELVKEFKGTSPILMSSSTNNPVMVRSWKKDGWTVIEKETTFKNKYQAYKYVV